MKPGSQQIEFPWSVSSQKVADLLQVDSSVGLPTNEAEHRLAKYGSNELQKRSEKSVFAILLDQFKSLIIHLLIVAAVISFLYGRFAESVAILIVLIINTAIGFSTEFRARKSMEALFRLGSLFSRVKRDGEIQQVRAEQLVPGDIVVIEGGDIITADLRLMEASKLQADESVLTGESLPVSKHLRTSGRESVLAERHNMLFKGTSVTRGSGLGVVVSTGMNTELGRITSLIQMTEDDETPLEKRLDKLGHKLIWVTLFITFIVTILGIWSGKEVFLMIETGIALAVATIPEGLPIVATIALARGMKMMADRNALINRLSSVETLGATSVIFSDKTGTLTENRMTVKNVVLESGEFEINGEDSASGNKIDKIFKQALEMGVLCNNAGLSSQYSEKPSGDPLEIALLEAGAAQGVDRTDLLKKMPEIREEAFDPEIKMMATYHQTDSLIKVAVKGAPEELLKVSNRVQTTNGVMFFTDAMKTQWKKRNHSLAARGLRVIALATKDTPDLNEDPYNDLIFIGLVGLHDPPRADVRDAIKKCRDAGIKIIMVTGDQPKTAQNIALAVGLIDDDKGDLVSGSDLQLLKADLNTYRDTLLKTHIFARVSPEQKLELIDFYRKNGYIVAMTGDGVNDAPALKRADIGIAMGMRGTQVAREAADMVLRDDAFSTIVVAIESGRIIFSNIRRFVYYLLSCNVSEVMVVGLASVIGQTLPVLPLQILFLNLVTDVFPALALGVGKDHFSVMGKPPRSSRESVLEKKHWLGIGIYGLLITFAVLGSLYISKFALKMEINQAVTISFLTLAFTQLWHVFNMRGFGTRIFRNEITSNPFVWGAIILCVLLLLAAVYVPPIASVLDTKNPGLTGWMLIIGLSLIPLFAGQWYKQFYKRS